MAKTRRLLQRPRRLGIADAQPRQLHALLVFVDQRLERHLAGVWQRLEIVALDQIGTMLSPCSPRMRAATCVGGAPALAGLTDTTTVASCGSMIRTRSALASVGTAGIPYQDAYLKAILDEAGVDPSSVEEINVGFSLGPAMITKKVDATLGAFWNVEGLELRERLNIQR